MANPAQPAKLVLADRDPLVRVVLTQVFDGEPGLRVAGEVETAEEARRLLAGGRADVMVVGDVTGTPLGDLTLARELRRLHPGTRVVLYTTTADEVGAEPAVDAVVPRTDPLGLVAAVRAMVARDGVVVLEAPRPNRSRPATRRPQLTATAPLLVAAAAVVALAAAVLVPPTRRGLSQLAGFGREEESAPPPVSVLPARPDTNASPTTGASGAPPPSLAPSVPVTAPPDATLAVALVNGERTARGLPALAVDRRLAGPAHAWAARVAGGGQPRAEGAAGRWTAGVAGTGPSVPAIVAALLASPADAALLLSPAHDAMAVGLVARQGAYTLAVVLVDLHPPATTTVPAPAPGPPPGRGRPDDLPKPGKASRG